VTVWVHQSAALDGYRDVVGVHVVELTPDVWLSLMLALDGTILQWVHSPSRAAVFPR
jgi:hypothetical protein